MTKAVDSGKKRQVAKSAKQSKPHRAAVRLWAKAAFLGFRRTRNTQDTNQALLKIEGVNDHVAAQYYLGKRVVQISRASNATKGKFRTSWGRISRAHGRNGVATALFARNLNPAAIGSTLRVFLFPQRA
uniref:Large ribosomal subunit protein eL33 n=1 Tax=Schistosoma japonicum TaxID=6182 RepID=Q4JL36_SCHJA|nr:unknown [Schistosoma japonicum]